MKTPWLPDMPLPVTLFGVAIAEHGLDAEDVGRVTMHLLWSWKARARRDPVPTMSERAVAAFDEIWGLVDSKRLDHEESYRVAVVTGREGGLRSAEKRRQSKGASTSPQRPLQGGLKGRATSESESPPTEEKKKPPLASLAAPLGARNRGWKRLPVEYQPSPKARALAASRGLDLEDQLEACRDYEFKKPHFDPEATFRTWLRNAKVHKPPGGYLTAAEKTQLAIRQLVARRGDDDSDRSAEGDDRGRAGQPFELDSGSARSLVPSNRGS